MSMPKITLVTAALLILIGVATWLAAGGPDASPTALIPAFAGVFLGLLGALAFKDSRRKAVMHGAVSLGVLLAAAALSRGALWKLPDWGELDEKARIATAGLSATAVVSLGFVALCVRSFIKARQSGAMG